MEEQNGTRRNRKPNKKTWQDYLPMIFIIVLGAIAVVSIITAIIAVVTSGGNDPTLGGNPGDATTLPTGSYVTTIPSSAATTVPTQSTLPSQGSIATTIPTTVKPNTPTPSSKPTHSTATDVDTLLAETDFIAKGYDYDRAIAMLENSSFKNNDQVMQKIAEYKSNKSKLVKFPLGNNVTHIFFHSLIVDPSRAFDGDEDQNGYNLYMTTVKEFKAILEEMYKNGYVLVSPYDMAYEVTDLTGTYFKKGEIWLPEGKKPFLMSQDDVNYYSYMVGTGNGKNSTPIFADTNGDGFAHKIVIGADGFPTCEYMDKNGNITTGDYDLVPILERFIQEHPDFSYRGARAILGMTGYEGVFGYRTKPSYEDAMGSAAYAKEVADAKAVAQCLRDHGWILASHSYGHPRYGDLTPERVEADSTKWENTVETIIGKTDVILFPHGSDIGNWRNYAADNEKFQILYADGYRYFFNVDSNQYWNQYGKNYFRGGRRNLDGYRMFHNPDKLKDLFDVSKVFDDARPTPVPSLSGGM